MPAGAGGRDAPQSRAQREAPSLAAAPPSRAPKQRRGRHAGQLERRAAAGREGAGRGGRHGDPWRREDSCAGRGRSLGFGAGPGLWAGLRVGGVRCVGRVCGSWWAGSVVWAGLWLRGRGPAVGVASGGRGCGFGAGPSRLESRPPRPVRTSAATCRAHGASGLSRLAMPVNGFRTSSLHLLFLLALRLPHPRTPLGPFAPTPSSRAGPQTSCAKFLWGLFTHGTFGMPAPRAGTLALHARDQD